MIILHFIIILYANGRVTIKLDRQYSSMTRSGTAQRMIQNKRGGLAVGGGVVYIHTLSVQYCTSCDVIARVVGAAVSRVNNVHRDEPLLIRKGGLGYNEALTDESLILGS